jgi:hypothetical protein
MRWPLSGELILVSEVFSLAESLYSTVLNLNSDDLRRNYKKWGPSARTCVRSSRAPEFDGVHEARVTADAKKLIANPEIPNLTGKLDEDAMAVPHKLFSVQPLKKGDTMGVGRMLAKAIIATHYIRKLISYEVAVATVHKRINFFQTLSRQPMLSGAVGTLFERFVLCWLASGSGSLQCTAKHTASHDLEIPACPTENQRVFLSSKTTLKDAKVTLLPSCFFPASQTFPTVDAIILTNDCLITVQVTISSEHSAKKAGFDIVRESGIRARKKTNRKGDRSWCHVFVTDEESKAKSLREQNRKELPEDISIYSAVFDVGGLDSSVEKIRAFEVSGYFGYTQSALIG